MRPGAQTWTPPESFSSGSTAQATGPTCSRHCTSTPGWASLYARAEEWRQHRYSQGSSNQHPDYFKNPAMSCTFPASPQSMYAVQIFVSHSAQAPTQTRTILPARKATGMTIGLRCFIPCLCLSMPGLKLGPSNPAKHPRRAHAGGATPPLKNTANIAGRAANFNGPVTPPPRRRPIPGPYHLRSQPNHLYPLRDPPACPSN